MGDFSCYTDIDKCLKYFYYRQKLAWKILFYYQRRLRNGVDGLTDVGSQKNLSPLGLDHLRSRNNGMVPFVETRISMR